LFFSAFSFSPSAFAFLLLSVVCYLLSEEILLISN
jgi:hypothetical protein